MSRSCRVKIAVQKRRAFLAVAWLLGGEIAVSPQCHELAGVGSLQNSSTTSSGMADAILPSLRLLQFHSCPSFQQPTRDLITYATGFILPSVPNTILPSWPNSPYNTSFDDEHGFCYYYPDGCDHQNTNLDTTQCFPNIATQAVHSFVQKFRWAAPRQNIK